MSRLTDLITQAKAKDPRMGADIEKEFKALSSRRSFGLNFEKHRPESVELPNRQVKKGDKVRLLQPRGDTKKGDQRLWHVKKITKKKQSWHATIVDLYASEPESCDVLVDDLVVIAEFRDKIFPGLLSTGKVELGGAKPFHSVINGENFHTLKALTYTHRGKVDAIYIDPPYNTGAKDWKYNNDYVEGEDLYRHSKWLAFIERRLRISKELLNPNSSVLIATIDEKEYLRLGLLLEQTFPESKVQMVSTIINSGGTGRANEFSRTNEFIYVVQIGSIKIKPLTIESTDKVSKIEWQTFRRRDLASKRGTSKGGKSQFYPIYVNNESGIIEKVGDHLPHSMSRLDAPQIPGCTAVFPARPDGTEMNWGTVATSFLDRLSKGYARAGKYTGDEQPYIIQYLKSGVIKDIEEGRAAVTGRNTDGSIQAEYVKAKTKMPTTQWDISSHNAEHYGTGVLKKIIGNRSFPFPKSLYAVEDILRLFVGSNRTATVLDFFSGSGTTAHALCRLNRQDGGTRQSISVTNNEVAASEQSSLIAQNLRPGDKEWEALGICEYVTKPRMKAAITGHTPEGISIKGDYKFTDEFPMSEGFKENIEFFTLTYESPIAVNHNLAFERISPILWLRAGSVGKRIDQIPAIGWELVETYGILVDLDKSGDFASAINRTDTCKIAYIVTNDDRRFQAVTRSLPTTVELVRLYESYLNNFQFANGE